MVKVPIPRKRVAQRAKVYVREWRNYMGVSAPDVADALDIERTSYLRLERESWRITISELDAIAKAIGVHSSQLRFPPPAPGEPIRTSLDGLLEDVPENVRQMAIAAVKAMIGK